MKLEIFTNNEKTLFGKSTIWSLFSALLLVCSFGQANAQCPLGCNNNVQISLDGDCSVEVTPDMVLEGQGTVGCDYTVVILGSNGQPIPNSPIVSGDYIGQTLTAEVQLGANSCWGYITIEDKLPPVIDCPDDVTVSCYESSNFPPPTATDNCTANVPVLVVSDDTVDLDCTDGFSARRTIVYQATDASGNKSAFCTRVIFFERIGLDEIVFPENRDDVEQPSLECDNSPFWDANGNGYPDVEETGTPETADGFSIFPNNSFCELNVTFSDQRLDICESSFKVLRKWTVLDWCTGAIEEQYQIVKVVDNAAPIVTCFPDTSPGGVAAELSADPYTCTADWDVIAPIVIFDCSSTTYEVAYLLADDNGDAPVNGIYIQDNVVTNFNGTFTINDLPLGRTWIRFKVTDDCGNVEYCFTEVDVVDNVPPVPVCDEFTVATLTTNGWARIFAESFDDGSHDNCSEVTLQVRRMVPGCSSPTIFADYADFCCADIGNEVMVELRVTDEAGNSNTCMVNVNVQDKLDPVITCPPNLVRDCGFDFLDLSLTGMATGSDNCGNVDITHQDFGSLGDCGTGTITRQWRATDAGGRSVTCNQTIQIIDQTPFSGSSISWPQNRNLTGCMMVDTDPSNTGMPIFNGDECSQIADTYEDQIFNFVDDACFKILRTWTVLDWCQFNQNNPSQGGIWQYTQVIKVNNFVAPEFTNCNNITVDAFGENCNAFVELVIGATDDCTPESQLVYSYELDFFNNGTIDDEGNGNDASSTYPTGLHRINWSVEDMCGNVTSCTHTFNVVDKKKPTPYCLSEITTVIMPSSGQIDIWANDFDLGSFDNCPGTLQFSFSSNVNDTSVDFFCEDVGIQVLEIWVTDAAGNQDFCTTQVNIQSNEGCTGSRIGGDIHAENGSALEEVSVTIQDKGSNETRAYMTPNTGHYEFGSLTVGADYELSAVKNDGHRNGVNTLDIVKIQRHILGIQQLDSPYKIIAADANNDGKIKSSDLLAIRKLVLGVESSFPNGQQSWRFVDAGQEFADMLAPFPFAEQITVDQFNSSVMDNHFMAVKIGDVDESAQTVKAKDDESETRSGSTIVLSVANVAFSSGDLVSVPVTAAEASEMVGLQFAMETTELEFVGIEAGALDLVEGNIAELESALAVSWNDVNARSYDKGEVLFTLIFRARTNDNLDNVLSISSTLTTAEAYTQTLETVEVEMQMTEEAETVVGFELLQNAPNPFADQTTIGFSIPARGTVALRVFDISGKVLATYNSVYEQGEHSITIDAEPLQTTGVMYYQLEYNGQVATKKMISIAK